MTRYLDRLILGANPLAGVDHFTNERARERALLARSDNTSRVIRTALEMGAGGFNFSPSAEFYSIFKTMKESGYDKEFGLYPILPDVRTYLGAFMMQGSLSVIRQLFADLKWSARAKLITQGGVSLATLDLGRAINAYIDMEISRLNEVRPQKAKLKTVLIFEAVTDMALAFRTKELIVEYFNHVRDKYGIKPGFVTRNLPRFLAFCRECGIRTEDIVIMTPLNKIGFQMTPSREACEEALNTLAGANVIGMSILAGGQINLDDAIEYLKSVRNVNSVAIGVSSISHAKETFSKLKEAPVLNP